MDLQCGDNAEDGDADEDHSRALESFRLLCGEADHDALRGLLGSVLDGGDGNLSPIILSADADKAHRSVGFHSRGRGPDRSRMISVSLFCYTLFLCRRCTNSSRGISSS